MSVPTNFFKPLWPARLTQRGASVDLKARTRAMRSISSHCIFGAKWLLFYLMTGIPDPHVSILQV